MMSISMINLKKLLPTLLYFFVILNLVACNESKSDNNNIHLVSQKSMQCLIEQSPCSFDVGAGRVEVLFDVEKIVAEQAFNMSVNYIGSDAITSVTGYMEGVEMFMGKIPVFLEHKSVAGEMVDEQLQTFTGELFVGSCSAQKMTWKMWLTFTTKNSQKISKMITLVSYRS